MFNYLVLAQVIISLPLKLYKNKMKKTLLIAAAAIMLSACSFEPTPGTGSADSTKVDTVKVDSIKTDGCGMEEDSTKKDSL